MQNQSHIEEEKKKDKGRQVTTPNQLFDVRWS